MDFTRNLTWENNDAFYPEKLDHEVYEYLFNSDAIKATPIERLQALNYQAMELFREHRIDLASEPVEIGVCAQHCNGGLKGNIWWESDLKHLFPVGEVNGSHGVNRPGGSALNAGQVGSYRAAQFISRRYRMNPAGKEYFLSETMTEVGIELKKADLWLSSGSKGQNEEILKSIRKRMSENGSIIRNEKKIKKACDEAQELLKNIDHNCSASTVKEIAECFMLSNNCLTHLLFLEAIKTYILNGGRSRGSFIVEKTNLSENPGQVTVDLPYDLCNYDRDVEEKILEIRYLKEKIVTNPATVRRIPEQNLWFEKVWKDYLEDNFIDS